MKVSVLLLAFNEAINLPRCLAALEWCDDVIVVDSGSTDGSVQIAERAGARVLSRPFDDFASQRNFGLEHGHARHEWVLHLDADEIAPPDFVAALRDLVPTSGTDAYLVPSKLLLHGRWLRYAGMYPAYQVRLGHRDKLRFKQVGHGQREDLPADRIGVFDVPYLHDNFSHGMRAWLSKHAGYAADEARQLLAGEAIEDNVAAHAPAVAQRRALKRLSRFVPLFLRPLARVVYVLIIRRGILDGRAGLLYACMLGVYEAMIALFVYERKVGTYLAAREPADASKRDDRTGLTVSRRAFPVGGAHERNRTSNAR